MEAEKQRVHVVPASAVEAPDKQPAERGLAKAASAVSTWEGPEMSPYSVSEVSETLTRESEASDLKKGRVAREASSAQKVRHQEQFKQRTGMSPKRCYRLVILSLSLRLLGGGWIAMVSMEYARYYVINDISMLNVLQTVTNSPQMALQAFLFPLWGVVADRCSRKIVLVAATLAQCLSACLLTFIPCVEVYIFTRMLNLVSDIGGPIRDAMLRDLFSDVEWESEGGGATGIKSRMALVGGVSSAASMAVGTALLAAGKMDWGLLPNEYQVRKEELAGLVSTDVQLRRALAGGRLPAPSDDHGLHCARH